MLNSVALYTSFFALTSCSIFAEAANAIQVTVPPSPPTHNTVDPNFLGVSVELSFAGQYFGNDTSTIPPAIVNYLKALRARTGSSSLRVRIGGNSMDSSNYDPSITSPMIQMIPGAANANDQSVNYGPVLWDVLNKVSSDVGDASYLIGLSLLNPNSTDVPLAAGDAANKLASSLDGFLLGNEPDLYTDHGQRPNIQNYTTSIYMNEFQEVLGHLSNTSAGDIPDKHDIVGPTICCEWDLDALLSDGYVKTFGSDLKYISLQHYPQDVCSGTYQFGISHYVQHANVVTLAEWQNAGIGAVLANNQQKVIMSEFNSVSCGGVPTVSDSFGVGSLWTTDYALQMASVGYSAAYLHTREQGISYNMFSPPVGPDGSPGPWTTGSPYYSLLATAEALRSDAGSIVVDLNIGDSKTNLDATTSGYAIYDAQNNTVQQLVFFNYANTTSSANSSVPFTIPAATFPSSSRTSVTVKYLVGDSLAETKKIGWGGQTLAESTDGTLQPTTATWAPPNTEVDCTNGCTINVPSPGMALVLAGGTPSVQQDQSPTNSTSNNGPSATNNANPTSAGGTPASTKKNSASRRNPLSTVYFDSLLCTMFLAWTIIC